MAALAITGTPYGPTMAALDADRRSEIMCALKARMSSYDGTAVAHVMTAVLGRGTAI